MKEKNSPLQNQNAFVYFITSDIVTLSLLVKSIGLPTMPGGIWLIVTAELS